MNTPAHALINLVVLNRNPSHAKTGAIVGGAILPDLVIIVFYGWHLWLGTPETQIWSVEYYRPAWQAWIDSFNSIPIFIVAMAICWKAERPLLLALFASMLLHAVGDLPLHHDDGHRHFFPLSDWRFMSPVSYWDPAHHGFWASIAEASCVLLGSIYLYFKHASFRPWVIGGVLVYGLFWIYVISVWM